jgi:O-methyltransferase
MTADLNEVVARFQPYPSVTVVPGFFADTLPEHDLAIKFAHIDCDLASSVRDVHRWLLDRMAVGGAIVYDDYGFESCFGLMDAVDRDVAPRRDYHTFSLPTGQYIAIRTAAA